ncbi:DUF1481 domain-containing protein [Vibrio ulleungensis]|uniref:DUF1481 domain-containing protein n=1 Tax=Vibrio ulleungensis TaxID=2807619 RepID=A0ABS2HL29_9VIBR|nr:DUF1481 domain-containing protein [Vibrio ulleungensis]MBM7038200.1 DUF1481 domain-containing protein [Vibrio ulleungensis]
MKRLLFGVVALFSLAACTSTSNSLQNQSQITEYSGGQIQGDATSLYWYTERLSTPVSASDYVTSGDYGWYQSEYIWNGQKLHSVLREGEKLDANNRLATYSVEVRFSDAGEAVYQKYQVGRKVIPLTQPQIEQYKSEAQSLVEFTTKQAGNQYELIQGYWDGSKFVTCNGNTFERLSFNQTLPSFVISRLSEFDSYMAFVGKLKLKTVEVDDLLLIQNESYDCIARPQLAD